LFPQELKLVLPASPDIPGRPDTVKVRYSSMLADTLVLGTICVRKVPYPPKEPERKEEASSGEEGFVIHAFPCSWKEALLPILMTTSVLGGDPGMGIAGRIEGKGIC
jgi:hypothetical protein